MVVDRQGAEPEPRRRVRVHGQVVEREGVAAEVHQRQMGTEVHAASVAQGRAAGGSDRGKGTSCAGGSDHSGDRAAAGLIGRELFGIDPMLVIV